MITEKDILSIGFLKKLPFTGGYRGMRYRLIRVEAEEKQTLEAAVWPEPLNYENTADDAKKKESFSFDEEGRIAAIEWLNEQYESDRAYWESRIGVL